jgi:hypothetical protein
MAYDVSRRRFVVISAAALYSGCARVRQALRTNADPPENVKGIVRKVLSNRAVARAEQLSGDDVAVLNAFATSVAGKSCQITSLEGCGSCCADNYRANLVHTTCGDQCWRCGKAGDCP